MNLLINNTQIFTSQDVNRWIGVMWITCGLLWWFYQLFRLPFWRHPFTARSIGKWCNAEFLQIRSDDEINSSTSQMAWEWIHFLQIFFLGYTIPCTVLLFHIMHSFKQISSHDNCGCHCRVPYRPGEDPRAEPVFFRFLYGRADVQEQHGLFQEGRTLRGLLRPLQRSVASCSQAIGDTSTTSVFMKARGRSSSLWPYLLWRD